MKKLIAIFLLAFSVNAQAVLCSATQASVTGTWWFMFDDTAASNLHNKVAVIVNGDGSINQGFDMWQQWTVDTNRVISEVFSRDIDSGTLLVGSSCMITNGFIDASSGWSLKIVTAVMDLDKHEIHGIIQKSQNTSHFFPVGFHAIKRN